MCEKAVRETVSEVSGVTDVRIDRKEERVWVSCSSEVSPQQVVEAIQSSGKFRARLIKE